MSQYIDSLMTNNFIDTDSENLEHLYSDNLYSDNYKNLSGGKPVRPNNMPSGGFPPIIIIERKIKEKEEEQKKRFFSVSNDNKKLSIKDILSKKL
jgi:hypothetical protein